MPLILFQSTPARERATLYGHAGCRNWPVSIHARSRAGDPFPSTHRSRRQRFNPPPPAAGAGATFVVMILSDSSVVSIHARSRAGDVKINKEMLKNRVSIHARSRAGDYGATQTGRL